MASHFDKFIRHFLLICCASAIIGGTPQGAVRPDELTGAEIGAHQPRLLKEERVFRISGPIQGKRLFLRYLPAKTDAPKGIVLYIHGSSFPSGLSIAYPFDGFSWRDDLVKAGFQVWGLDFYGYGWSDRPDCFFAPPQGQEPFGTSKSACEQIKSAVEFIRAFHHSNRIDLIAHSWGTIPAGRFACEHSELVRRLVFFGPVLRRGNPSDPDPLVAWTTVSAKDQHDRFFGGVPKGEPPVMLERHFLEWADTYLASDSSSGLRTPPSVKVPAGPNQDVDSAWSGKLPYDLGCIRCPILIVRGEWDPVSPDLDVAWGMKSLSSTTWKQDVKIPRATHLMHLEQGRFELYKATREFLLASKPPAQKGAPLGSEISHSRLSVPN